ncbi:hemolysin E [Salmonella enterica subsp. enterica serovar Give]|nr:hemolysin E [Salmonella enterica subsp. enterica serovar Give]
MKLSVTLAFFGYMMASSLAQASDINMWREPKPVVKEGKYYSLIMDRGELQKAVKSNNNNYLFSEKGAGVKPLVLIGSPVEISEFMLQNKTRSIENHIKGLPDIYIGVTKYKPKQRFTGLFPLQDILTQTVDQVSKFVPGTAAGVIEGKLIPELNNRLKAVQNFFTSLSATVKQANKDIDAAKLKLATEIAAIGEIKTETETTRFYVDYDDLMLSLLKGAAKKMINTCNEYQQRHGKKTLLEVPDV